MKIPLLLLVSFSAACGPVVRDPEPDAEPAPALRQCTECEFGWTCDVATVGWRCWGGTREACEPHPDDPVCPTGPGEP